SRRHKHEEDSVLLPDGFISPHTDPWGQVSTSAVCRPACSRHDGVARRTPPQYQ
ncbi:unnamed protein product, partial [Candidula unifasciata]